MCHVQAGTENNRTATATTTTTTKRFEVLFYFFFLFLAYLVRHCRHRTSMQQFSTFNTNFIQRPGALSNTVPSQFKLTIDDHSRLINFSEFH